MSSQPANLAAMIEEAERIEAANAPPALDKQEKKRYSNRTKPKLWARRKRAAVIEYLGGHCWVCGSENNLCIDHEGGSRTWDLKSCLNGCVLFVSYEK